MFVIKRDGSKVPFDASKIETAIRKAFLAQGYDETNTTTVHAPRITSLVTAHLQQMNMTYIPIETIQDDVEKVLMEKGYFTAGKAYILYREKRAEMRKALTPTPIQEQPDYFQGDTLGQFVYTRTYSRWREQDGRRETWPETVQRYMDFMRSKLEQKLTESEYQEVQQAILKMEVMPSMRLLQFAGPAAERCNACVYNCAFIAPESPQDLSEIMYLSMSGTGVGFSVEAVHVNKFPVIKAREESISYYVIEDSKEGWADAFSFAMEAWYRGHDITFDYSKLRPAGARLKTTGGRSSGPQPLKDLMNFTRELMISKVGTKLSPLNIHDIICKIGQIVIAGGTRRSALCSLSDLNDAEIRDCKNGPIWNTNSQRYMSNNSAVYMTKPTDLQFMTEWLRLCESGTGERGIFNRSSLKKVMPARRIEFLGDRIDEIGMNPCFELLLQSKQFCNLSEVICRSGDDAATLMRKIRIATIIGTFQSSLTKFNYLSPRWHENQQDERLLGVSLTGIMDCELFTGSLNTDARAAFLRNLKQEVIKTNVEYASRFMISPSMGVTCLKPSGSVSQMTNSSSGIHARYAKFYIRRVRIAAHDPLFNLMKDQGYPHYPETGQDATNPNTWVLEFPVAAPARAVVTSDMTALQQLEFWKEFKINYTEHNPSVTISVKPNEWIDVQKWVMDNWDYVTGLSFLPFSEHLYPLAPYEEISEEEYMKHPCRTTKVNFSKLAYYEKSDTTDVKRELACAGGACEL